ncbi:MAG: hypothetical protein ACYCTI_00110 [Acidimicrobiales bacterium]
MAVIRRHGGPSEKVVLLGGPRDGEELVILGGDLLPEIPDDIQGVYHLASDRTRPERDRSGRPIYRWEPGGDSEEDEEGEAG